jgi:hypothetical protein
MNPAAEQRLTGGRITSGVVRVGDTVRRPKAKPNLLAHRLLTFLADAGFDAVPHFLGIDDQGRETLSFIAGAAPADLGHYDDAPLGDAARLIRRFHDATAGFPDRDGHAIVCHNDLSPCNFVFVDARPVAIIDFDSAAPGSRLWDLGYAAHAWLDLGSPDYAPAEQLRRLGIFAAAYGLTAPEFPALAAHIAARLASLAAWARDSDQRGLADWAAQCRDWVCAHILDPQLPSFRNR